MTREEFMKIAGIKEEDYTIEEINRNLMGCDERWYDPGYAITQTFTEEEIEAMSDAEINNLIKLAEAIGEALF